MSSRSIYIYILSIYSSSSLPFRKEVRPIALRLSKDASETYRIPVELTNTRDPYIIGTYICLLRYSSLCNEVNGSIATYVKFLGHTNDYINMRAGAAKQVQDSLLNLSNARFIALSKKSIQNLTPRTHFMGKFKSNAGWRREPSSLDAKFSFREIEDASKAAQKTKWVSGDLSHIIQITAFLRQHSDANAIAYSNVPQKQRNVCVIDFDDTCNWLHIKHQTAYDRLKLMRKFKLGTYRLVTFELPRRYNAFPGKHIRYLLYGPYGRSGGTQVTAAYERLKSLYKGSKVVFDSNNPKFREGGVYKTQ